MAMERRMVKMTLKLMTQQVLENFLVAPQCLGLIELLSLLVKKRCKCGSTTHLRTSHRDCPMGKRKKHKDDSIDPISE